MPLDEVSPKDSGTSASASVLQQQEGGASSQEEESSDWEITDDELRLLDPETRQLVMESMQSGSDSDFEAEDDDVEAASAPLSASDDQMNGRLPLARTGPASMTDGESDTSSTASSAPAGASEKPLSPGEAADQDVHIPALLSSHGLGRSNASSGPGASSQPALENNSAALGGETSSDEDSFKADPATSASAQPAYPEAAHEPGASLPVADGDRPEAGTAAGTEAEEEEQLYVDEAELEAAIAASRSWSRVVRKPRTRHRHVILDVCAAKRTGSGQSSTEGQLLQQVVGKADIAWAGAKGYRIARKTRWGDLWPTCFQDQAIIVTGREPGGPGSPRK